LRDIGVIKLEAGNYFTGLDLSTPAQKKENSANTPASLKLL